MKIRDKETPGGNRSIGNHRSWKNVYTVRLNVVTVIYTYPGFKGSDEFKISGGPWGSTPPVIPVGNLCYVLISVREICKFRGGFN